MPERLGLVNHLVVPDPDVFCFVKSLVNILYWTYTLLSLLIALKINLFCPKKLIVTPSEVQKCKILLDNFHMVLTLIREANHFIAIRRKNEPT